MDEYVVSVTPLGASGRAFALPTQRTPEFTLTVSQLQNGQAYKFTVQVGVQQRWGSDSNGGGGVAVEAVWTFLTSTVSSPLPLLQAYSRRFNGGGSASVEGTPARPTPSPQLCSRLYAPSGPTDLVATPAHRSVGLCWGPPANRGCVDEVSQRNNDSKGTTCGD